MRPVPMRVGIVRQALPTEPDGSFPSFAAGEPIFSLVTDPDAWFGPMTPGDAASRSGVSRPGPAAAVRTAMMRAVRRPSRRRLAALYELAHTDGVEGFASELLVELRTAAIGAADLAHLGRWLATTADHPGPVGIGLVTLGAAGLDATDVVERFVPHPQFTDLALLAARAGAADADQLLWTLAKTSSGDTRDRYVAHLNGTTRHDIKRWIIRTLCPSSNRNRALLGAVVGELHMALATPKADPEIAAIASRLLCSLATAISSPDLAGYPHAQATIDGYLDLVAVRRSRYEDLITIRILRRHLMNGDARHTHDRPWDEKWRTDTLRRCVVVLADDWDEAVETALGSGDPNWFASAADDAEARGIDTFPHRMAHLETGPLEADWGRVLRGADHMRTRRLVSIAATSITDDEATWSLLDSVLPHLPAHPGVGDRLVLFATRSPVARHRLGAIEVLAAWDRETWPGDAPLQLAMLVTDPDPQVRRNAERLAMDPESGP